MQRQGRRGGFEAFAVKVCEEVGGLVDADAVQCGVGDLAGERRQTAMVMFSVVGMVVAKSGISRLRWRWS